LLPRGPADAPAPPREPLLPRSLPTLGMATLTDRPVGPGPPSKFGGQPDWLEEPVWPLDRERVPRSFYGQLALIDQPGRLVYLFTAIDGEDPDHPGSGSAALVQPKGT